MKTKKYSIAGVPIELASEQEIINSKAPILAVPRKTALPFDRYPAGTKGGFPCSVCSQECILAPSSQRLIAYGLNPVICADCALKLALNKEN